MNIFALDQSPHLSAEMMVDSHVVKMILESCQLLSTAHRVLDGVEYIDDSSGRKIKRWSLPDYREAVLYKATHINHPSAIWCRATETNYHWLYTHLCALFREYTFRYDKVHACEKLRYDLLIPPQNIPDGPFTPVTPAMPDKYIIPDDHVASYRAYYIGEKQKLFKWTKREKPAWIT